MEAFLPSVRDLRPHAAHPVGSRGIYLKSKNASYRVLRMGSRDCVIERPDKHDIRGYVDLYEDDEQIARCLIVCAEPQGDKLVCAFKRKTYVRATPPADFAS